MEPFIGYLRWLIRLLISTVFFTTLFNLLRDFGVPGPILFLVFLAIIATIIFFRIDKGNSDKGDGDVA
jgi:Na+-driven multidrug efflux pump